MDANPIENNILFYALRILHLGIQLHFVLDGPKRMSNGGKEHPGHDAPSELLRQTFTMLGFPWHEAPAEAEAECANMEIEGLVDGVWSEDGDALAFGCQTLIRFHREVRSSTERKDDTRKSYSHFKVYKLEELATKCSGMGREGFVLHAILNGNSSDIGELHGLEPRDILDAAEHGLGLSLCEASGSDETLMKWASTELATYLKDNNSQIRIPARFPKWEHVQDYLTPLVSTAEALSHFNDPCDPLLDEKVLFSFLAEKFQWTLTQWVRYALPFLIVRSLLATEEGEENQHNRLELLCDVKKQKSPKKAKATFLIKEATALDVSTLTLSEPRAQLETLRWILRKANFNGQRSIISYFTPPKSDRKGKGVASSPVTKKVSQSGSGGNGSPRASLLIPTSSSSSNGEDPSKRKTRSRREQTPPSPTPHSRRRPPPLPSSLNASTSKNTQPSSKLDHQATDQTSSRGKGKAKEIQKPSRINKKRPRSPVDSSNSSEEFRDKRPMLAATECPSTPPAQITAPMYTGHGVIVLDSDSEEDKDDPNPVIALGSDSDDEYGSFPSVTNMSAPLEDSDPKVVQDGDLENSSSGSDYGSFPASPELLAMT